MTLMHTRCFWVPGKALRATEQVEKYVLANSLQLWKLVPWIDGSLIPLLLLSRAFYTVWEQYRFTRNYPPTTQRNCTATFKNIYEFFMFRKSTIAALVVLLNNPHTFKTKTNLYGFDVNWATVWECTTSHLEGRNVNGEWLAGRKSTWTHDYSLCLQWSNW